MPKLAYRFELAASGICQSTATAVGTVCQKLSAGILAVKLRHGPQYVNRHGDYKQCVARSLIMSELYGFLLTSGATKQSIGNGPRGDIIYSFARIA